MAKKTKADPDRGEKPTPGSYSYFDARTPPAHAGQQPVWPEGTPSDGEDEDMRDSNRRRFGKVPRGDGSSGRY